MSRAAGILLAAGPSSRLGRDKQLLPLKETTLLRRAFDHLAAVARPVIVVLPAGRTDLEREVPAPPARIVLNDRVDLGMGGSLALGARTLAATREEIDLVLVALVDQPLADRALFSALVDAAREAWGYAACDYGTGAWGAPACLPASALAALAGLSGERGARALLEPVRARGELALVPFPGGRFDVDTEADYARLLAALGAPDAGPGSSG